MQKLNDNSTIILYIRENGHFYVLSRLFSTKERHGISNKIKTLKSKENNISWSPFKKKKKHFKKTKDKVLNLLNSYTSLKRVLLSRIRQK